MAFRNDIFVAYLKEAVGAEAASVVLSALDEPPSVSVRVNPFKKRPDFPGAGQQVPWSGCGFMLGSRPVFTLDPYFSAGCYYVQDSSSMFVGHVLRQVIGGGCPGVEAAGNAVPVGKSSAGRPAIRVLDLCAAPGGKTTDAAASLRAVYGDSFFLVSNEVIRARASVLATNVAVWGDPNVAVTSADPSEFSSLPGFFDIVLADVPCSGEGMFRKDADAAEQWSPENVAHCQARQRRILADVWPALAENGILIYSTCTFNRYENDDNVKWAVENLGAEIVFPGNVHESVFKTDCGCSLLPGFVKGEGQYCAVLRKSGKGGLQDVKPDGIRRLPVQGNARRQEVRERKSLPSADICRYFDIPVRTVVKGNLIKAVPEAAADDAELLERTVRVISSGCAAGTLKGRDMVPHADMALNIRTRSDVFPRADLDLKAALQFLRRESFALPEAEKGYVMVSYGGAPLGFVKNIGSRCNNLHPAERRIRMDIKEVDNF